MQTDITIILRPYGVRRFDITVVNRFRQFADAGIGGKTITFAQ